MTIPTTTVIIIISVLSYIYIADKEQAFTPLLICSDGFDIDSHLETKNVNKYKWYKINSSDIVMASETVPILIPNAQHDKYSWASTQIESEAILKPQ